MRIFFIKNLFMKKMNSCSIVIKNSLDNKTFINFDAYDDINELTDVIYTSFNDNNKNIMLSLKYVINYEVKTLINVIINTYKISKNQLLELSYHFNELPQINHSVSHSNYIFKLLGNRSEQDEELLYLNMEYLYDTFEKDADFFNVEEKYTHIIIMTYRNRYYGHIYMDINEKKITGLRTSLYNFLCENHGFIKLKDVGYYLLDECVKLAKDNKLDELFIENINPIMKRVCNEYGFDENHHLNLVKIEKDTSA